MGSSVLACKFKGGVLVAADTAISYGGMKNVKNAPRVYKLNDEMIYGCGGEMADVQNLKKMLEKKEEVDSIAQDGAAFLKPRDYLNWISRTCYNRRLKMDPLWCSTIVAGVRKDTGEIFLGSSDLYGTVLEENYLLTGLALHYCQVLMENEWRAEMSEQEAKALMAKCFRVMFFRDKKAIDRVQFAVATQEGGSRVED